MQGMPLLPPIPHFRHKTLLFELCFVNFYMYFCMCAELTLLFNTKNRQMEPSTSQPGAGTDHGDRDRLWPRNLLCLALRGNT